MNLFSSVKASIEYAATKWFWCALNVLNGPAKLPLRIDPRISTTIPKEKPLWDPSSLVAPTGVCIIPATSFGSSDCFKGVSTIIGFPFSSVIHPGARGTPILWATLTLLVAIALVAASNTNGAFFNAGAATAIGFVPIPGIAACVGTTLVVDDVIQVPIISWSNAIIAWYAAIPKCLPFPILTNPTPVFLAFSIAISMHNGTTTTPRPLSESTVAQDSVSLVIFQFGLGFADPSLKYWT